MINSNSGAEILSAPFSREVFELSYKFSSDATIHDTIERMVDFVASPESESFDWVKSAFNEEISSMRFIPAGRVWSNAGTGLKGTSLINCFVDGFEGVNQDSVVGISNALKRQAKILKSEGGYGFCADVMRPRGAYIAGIGGESIGSVGMLDLWQSQSNVFTRGNEKQSGKRKRGKKKIRNGAQMVTLSVWHPDIEEFILAKQEQGVLTRMNMSVLIPDAFVEAVNSDDDWELEFPDYEDNPEAYHNHWDGDVEKWKKSGGAMRVYKTVKATYLWNLLTDASYNRNEPAMLFVDRINSLNNLRSIEKIKATNPCGEQPLPIGGACLLGSVNLVKFVDASGFFDFESLGSTVRVAVRFLDNVNDVTYVPLEEQAQNLTDKRRVGLGIMGLASMLMMMKMRYGSDEAIEMTSKVMRFIANSAYMASTALASEKGSFPLFSEVRGDYLDGVFIARLDDSVRKSIADNGIRNSHLISIQPTGNTSILAGIVSGGLEPVFNPTYIRTSRVPIAPDGIGAMPVGMKPDGVWSRVQEGDEWLMVREFDGIAYKYNEDRGLLKESRVEDYAVRWHKARGTWDDSADWACGSQQLSVSDHIEMTKAVAWYVDSAVSKTINLPEWYSFEDFKDVYMKAYESGSIKGITTYRDGTMSTVLSTATSSIDGDSRRGTATLVDVAGSKYAVILGYEGSKPYEMFIIECNSEECKFLHMEGAVEKRDYGYDFVGAGITIKNLTSGRIGDGNSAAVARLISLALKNGAEVQDVIVQLTGGIFLSPILMSAVEVLNSIDKPDSKQEACPSCGGRLVLEEGCKKCMDCSWSACSV